MIPSQTCSVAIACYVSERCDEAVALSASLGLPLLPDVDETAGYSHLLQIRAGGLSLQATGRKAPGPVSVNFFHGEANHRRHHGGGKGQMIAKAVGLKGSYRPTVLDATAGLGGDAFVLATLGCRMMMLERSPLVHVLLQDGLLRARDYAQDHDPQLLEIIDRMTLIAGDSASVMTTLTSDQYPDVVYLDPMFPERSKSASVKKSMATFHVLVGEDADSDALLPAALAIAKYRVAVKRPVKAPFLKDQPPSYQLKGKSCRYDIYALRKMPEHQENDS